MATTTQIYNLINAVAKESLGANAITAKDTASFVAVGNEILRTDQTRDNFYQKLADRISYVYVKYKTLNLTKDKAIFMTPFEFGSAMQKIQVFKLGSASSNKSWEQSPNQFADGVDHTDIVQQIYKGRGVFEINKVIYDYQLDTAFESETKFASFVNMIFQDMYNAMELDLDNMAKLAKATAMANCIAQVSTAPNCARNLLSEYNLAHPSDTLTVAEALENLSFLKFASREINLTVKRMQEPSELFNTAGADRWSAREEIVVDVLADFSTATTSYLEADTYHKELVSLPLYEESNKWQGTGTDFAFDSTSKINITNGALTVEQDGIIAFVHDRESVGCMYDRVRTKSEYSAINERTYYAHKCDKGYYIDTTEQAVVFYIAES